MSKGPMEYMGKLKQQTDQGEETDGDIQRGGECGDYKRGRRELIGE